MQDSRVLRLCRSMTTLPQQKSSGFSYFKRNAMDSLTSLLYFLVDFIIHIDTHLQLLAAQYGFWLYAILFVIVFCETGLVVTPFLPGDSLLFAAGSLASMPGSSLDPHLLFLLFFFSRSAWRYRQLPDWPHDWAQSVQLQKVAPVQSRTSCQDQLFFP